MVHDPAVAERVRRVAAELLGSAAEDGSVRRVLLERVVDAVDRISHAVDDRQLRAVIDAESDTTLLSTLSRLASLDSGPVSATDPLAAARARGEQAKRDILVAQGDMLDVTEVAARLRIGVGEVEARRQRGLLLAIPLGDGSWGFPIWQFTGDGVLPGLEDVLRDLGTSGPWAQAAFFTGGDIRLNWQTPLEVLLRGEIAAVRRAAAAYGEQVPA